MKLRNGTYCTRDGSTVKLSGTHGGISVVDFDWFEEPNACIDCHPDPYPEHWGSDEQGKQEHRLVWSCGECGGGSATLTAVDEPVEEALA